MDNLEDKFRKEGRKVTLLQSEKDAMKNRILAMPNLEPEQRPGFSLTQIFVGFKPAWAALALLLAASVPLTYSAQKSGPGEFLHKFELSIVEPVQGVIYTASGNQAQYSADRLRERLLELQAVPDKDITGAQVSELSENLQGHVNDLILALPGTQGNGVDQLVEIAAILQAQEDMLAETGQHQVDEIENLNGDVREALATQVKEISQELAPDKLLQEINDGLAETNELIKDDATDPETAGIAEHLTSAQEEILKGNLEEALQETLDAKVEALAQDYSK